MNNLTAQIAGAVLLCCSPFLSMASEKSPAAPPPPTPAASAELKPDGKAAPKPENPLLSFGTRDARLTLRGTLQLWATVHEEMENGRQQAYTDDRAVQESSGFSFRRVRLSAEISLWEGAVEGKLEMRFEETPGLMDAWGRWNPWKDKGYLKIQAGQMKVPSTYEVDSASSKLDFPSRTTLSQNIVNWSLVRNPSLNTTFRGVKAFLRDTGLALRGEVSGFSYFAMVGNGLGANLFIGANENPGYITANAFGAYFIALRAQFDLFRCFKSPSKSFPITEVRLGGHVCQNRHHDMVLIDQRTVVDLVRFSWSLDATVNILDRVRFTAMIGGGHIADDVNNVGVHDYDYDGWELKTVVVILPKWLEAGFRVDTYTDEKLENGVENVLTSWTFGVTFTALPYIRIQAAYKIKDFDALYEPDLNDNSFILAAQLTF